MPRHLTVTPHLSVDDLEQRYRACRVPVERTRWHLLWLVAQDQRRPQAARLVSYTADWAASGTATTPTARTVWCTVGSAIAAAPRC